MSQGNWVAICVFKMDGTQEAAFFLPLAVDRRPVDFEHLPIPEQIGRSSLPDPQVDIELQMANPVMCGEQDDNIFEGELASGQAVGGRDERGGAVGQVGEAQVAFGNGIIFPASLCVIVVENVDVGGRLAILWGSGSRKDCQNN